MKLRTGSTILLAVTIASIPAFAARVHRAPTSGKHHHTKHTAVSHKMHGQQTIAPERVEAIQEALIREHYLTGEPTSKWDDQTQSAMLKFQGDQGWQTKITPDSRALIKLGLGPDHSNAINASSTTDFNQLSAPQKPTPATEGFIAGSGVSH